ncbi:histidine triad (HIT) family protein [Gordonia hydrophobica]|nr:histidine triad (HIT) family protein [Gordonia hydrophobica]
MSDQCVFCGIIDGVIPSSKVYEDEQTYAFTTPTASTC